MNTAAPRPFLTLSTQFYCALLILYPRPFRDEYGPHMAQVFRDCCRDVYRQSEMLGLLRLWISTLGDLMITALEERLTHHGGPANVIHKIGIGLAAGLAGGAVAGLGARLAMRGVSLSSGLTPNFTLEGTLNIVIVGLVMGLPFGPAFVALRQFIPGNGLWKGLNYGVILFVIFLAPPFFFYREGEATLATPLVTVSLFGPVALAYGLAVQAIVMRLDPQRKLAQLPSPFGLTQILWFILFALVLELSVLGTISILNHMPRIPPGIVRTMHDASIPFAFVRDTNIWLINLIALGYFGVSALIFWHRSRPWMTRFTAFALFLFGGALFNTGAGYYDDLVADISTLQRIFNGIQIAGLTSLIALLYLFPNGRFSPTWTRPLIAAWGLWAILWLWVPLPEPVIFVVLTAFLGTGLAAQASRYRAASLDERPRLRWPLIGFAIAILGFALITILLLAFPDLKLPQVNGLSSAATFSLYMLPWLCIPLSIGWAMRRYRLWDAALN